MGRWTFIEISDQANIANGERYKLMIINFFNIFNILNNLVVDDMWFLQDGTPSDTAKATMVVLLHEG